MKMAFNLLILNLFICLFYCQISYASEQSSGFSEPLSLRVAFSQWPPFVSKDLPNDGFSPDLLRRILDRLGIKYTIEITDFEHVLEGVKNNKYDLVPSIWYRQDRLDFLIYTDPYLKGELNIVSFSNERLGGLSALKGKKLGLVKSYSYPPSLLNIEGATYIYSLHPNENFDQLWRNEVEYIISDSTIFKYKSKELENRNQSRRMHKNLRISTESIFMGVRRSHSKSKEISKAISLELRKMKASGEIDSLYSRHLNYFFLQLK